MIKISNLQEIRLLPDGPAKRAMEANAALCHGGDADLKAQMEDDFDITLGGNWYLVEDGDDLTNLPINDDRRVDLLGDEWRWCDVITLENGYFMVFWATNNAGGPCMFIEGAPWVPLGLREWLEAQVLDCIEEAERIPPFQ